MTNILFNQLESNVDTSTKWIEHFDELPDYEKEAYKDEFSCGEG